MTIRDFAKNIYERLLYRRLRVLCRRELPKIIIGAHVRPGLLLDNGWISTSQKSLDMLKEENWQNLFGNRRIGALLAEHVWEHLTPEDGLRAAEMCFAHLAPGGWLRVAVPDGLHPGSEYIQKVRPGGSGAGSDDHKVLYTYVELSNLFGQVGFQVDLLEYFDSNGTFHKKEWSSKEGHIHRSSLNDIRNVHDELVYTSIILDARKP